MRGRSLAVAVIAVLLAVVSPLLAQQWTFTNWVGPAGGDSLKDGNGANARIWGARILVNPAGSYVYITGAGTVRRYEVATGEVTSLAGWPYVTGVVDGADANARFLGPIQMAWDPNGNMVFGDTTSHWVRRLSPAGISSYVTGGSSSICANGQGSQAGFYYLWGTAVDKTTGNIFVSDYYTGLIRKITPSGAVTTLAGQCNVQGSADGTGAAAQFYYPTALAIDGSGNIFVADTQNDLIRKITPAGVVTTIVGTAQSGNGYRDGAARGALFGSIESIAIAPNGDLYIADGLNHAVRKYASGTVSTVAGSGSVQAIIDGPLATARFDTPSSLTIDDAGVVYVSDRSTLRRIANGVVTTLAGSTSPMGAADGVGAAALFNSPRSVAVDGSGTLFVGDMLNGVIRRVSADGTVTTAAGVTGSRGIVDGPPGVGKLAPYEGLTVDSHGNIYDGESLTIRKAAPDGTISTLAGNAGASGWVDGSGVNARFNYMYGLCTGPQDEVYVADTSNQVIRKVLPDGTTSTLAGLAHSASFADGSGTTAHFNFPTGCVYSGGFLYIADSGNSRIRRVTLAGVVTTVAGTATAGSTDSSSGINSTFSSPWSISADGAGHLFVFDRNSGKVRELFPANNFATVTIGPGTYSVDDGTFNDGGADIWSMTADANGTLYMVSASGHVRKATPVAIADTPIIDAVSGPVGMTRTLGVNGNSATSWLWEIVRRPAVSSPQGAALSNPAIATPTFTPDTAGLYRFHLTASGPAGISIRNLDFTATCATVTAPAPVVASGSNPSCSGAPLTIDAGAGYTSYLWSTGATTRTITASPSATTTYTVAGFSGICSSTSVPITITIAATATNSIMLAGSGTVCSLGAGGTATVTDAGGPVVAHQWVWRTGTGAYANLAGKTSLSYVINGADFPGPGTYGLACRTTPQCGTPAVSNEITITVVPPQPATITAGGPTTFCAGGSVTLTATAGASYLWSNGATTQSIAVDASGSYNVTVPDANGCSVASAPTVVTVNTLPVATITPSGPAAICAGGSVTLSASPGASWLWSNGATTQSISATAAGSYGVTVTDSKGCSAASTPVTVTVNPLPVVTITPSGPTTFCAGGNVTLTASGGSSYHWSNGATTASIVIGSSGGYSVTATDTNGCSATSAPTVVTVNPLPSATISASGPTAFCAGGSVTLTAAATASYAWSNGATTQSITVSSAGMYAVTVFDANGCSATSATVSVTVNPLPDATITVSGSTTLCDGASVMLAAPAGMAAYSWSNGATTQSISVSAAGTYGVTVTSGTSCSATSAPVIVVQDATIVTIAGDATQLCPGGTLHLTSSVSGGNALSYQWYTAGDLAVSGANGPTLDVVAPGSSTYFLRVGDVSSCTVASNVWAFTVDAPQAHVTASGPVTFCQGGSVILTAAESGTYLWSTGATTRSITVNAGGTYGVTISDAAGCSATSTPTTVTVYASPVPSISAGGATTFCQGGSVTLTATAAGSYLWSNGATTQSIVVSSSGSYSVSVTDANGCSGTSAPVPVTVHQLPLATITAGGPIAFCSGGNVTLTASPAASYLWSNGATTQSIATASAGNYSVQVTDANGCSNTSAAMTVSVYPNPQAIVTAGGPTTFCAGGNVTLTASNGASWQWSNGATTQSIVVGSSGNYGFTVTDANGCSATSLPTSVTVNPLPAATITPSGPTTFCAGGSVTLTSSNGASYLWSTGATTPSITVSSSGGYSVAVTDANGCSATSTPAVVTVNANPAATITAGGPTTFCAGGSVTLTASSGSSYLWSNGATSQSISANASGSYGVTVTNANGCSATSTATTVTVNANPTSAITPGGPTTFCAGGSVTLMASSGSSYLWSNGATSQSISANASGSYSVTVTNSSGCSATSAPTAVTVNANPATPVITAGGPTTFCAGGSVTLTAPAASSYAWSNGATTQSISANASGSYSVTVTNASGCSASSTATTVTVNANPTATITAGGPTTFCAGGSVTLTASSGSSYLWSNGATTQAITASAGGNYGVTVTNASGCNATSIATTVTVNANLTAAITPGGPTTFCAGGSVTLTASSGSFYLWSNGATSQSISANAGGSYSVTVTNASGCSTTSAPTAVTVNAKPATPVITAGGPTTFCAGGSVTLTASSGSSYLWSNGATTQAIAASSSGSYSVTVTNASSCSATSAPTAVTVNANPTATITPGGPTTFCTGSTVTLTAPAGFTYTWSTSATTQSIVVSSSGSYSVTTHNGNGCSATSAPVVVTVKAPPTSVVSGTASICAGGSTTITATLTGTAPWSVTWSDGVVQPIASGTTATRSVSPAATTTYTVTTLTDATCSGTSSGSAVVTVKPLPTATVSGGGSICPGASATITATLTGTAPWSVTWSDGVVQPIASGTTASRSVSPAATTTYTVTSVSDAKSCPRAGTGSAVVTVKQLPTAIVSGTGSFCPGGSVTITATLTGTAPWTVKWSDNVTQTINSGTTATRSVSPAVTTTYTVTSLSDAASCPTVGTGSAVVTRNVAASITTQPTNKTTTRNTNVTLAVVAAGTAPLSYQWHLGSGAIISGATSSSYTTSFPNRGTNTFYVEVWNACNTTNVRSSTVTVTVN